MGAEGWGQRSDKAHEISFPELLNHFMHSFTSLSGRYHFDAGHNSTFEILSPSRPTPRMQNYYCVLVYQMEEPLFADGETLWALVPSSDG